MVTSGRPVATVLALVLAAAALAGCSHRQAPASTPDASPGQPSGGPASSAGSAGAGSGATGSAAQPGAAQTVLPQPAVADSGPAKINHLRLADGGRTLVLGFPAAACETVSAAEATEALASVQVSVHLGKAPHCAPAARELWTVLHLSNPLGPRLVLDVDHARQLTVG